MADGRTAGVAAVYEYTVPAIGALGAVAAAWEYEGGGLGRHAASAAVFEWIPDHVRYMSAIALTFEFAPSNIEFAVELTGGTEVPDNGGVIVVGTAASPSIWSEGDQYTVTVTDGTIAREAYSGVVGSGAVCTVDADLAISFVAPPMPLGKVDVTFTEIASGDEIVELEALEYVHRDYTTSLYMLRYLTGANNRDVGPRDITEEDSAYGVGVIMPPLAALILALADELALMGGQALTRTTAVYTAGDASLSVESTWRFPASGRIAFAGKVAAYATKTQTSFEGLTDAITGATGVDTTAQPYATVMDYSRTESQIERLIGAFMVATADGSELATYGRVHGFPWVRGLTEEDYRSILREVNYGLAQTLYLCEQVLDILLPGGYELYEDLESYPHTIFVSFDTGFSSSYAGKTFLCGGEAQSRTSTTTVDVDADPVTVYGVWDSTDYDRTGTNYAEKALSVTVAGAGMTSAGLFVASDDGKTAIIDDSDIWEISYTDASNATLSTPSSGDGLIASAGTTFQSTGNRFAPWMVGHNLVITSGDNAGIYTIDEYLSPQRVTLSSSVDPDTDVAWHLTSSYSSSAATARVLRATFAGNTITTPVTMPADVLVDYTTIPSAQQMADSSENGDDQYPFYLWGETYVIQTILDLITASGVRVVVTPE